MTDETELPILLHVLALQPLVYCDLSVPALISVLPTRPNAMNSGVAGTSTE